MDLKALLVEAKQKVPPVLQVLQTGDETMLDIGGDFTLTCYPVTTLCFIYKCSSQHNHFKINSSQFLTYVVVVVSQERGAVHFVVVWVIVSQTVQNWRPCRRSRSQTSGGKTTWLIAQWTFKCFPLEERPCKTKRNSLLRKTVHVSCHWTKEVYSYHQLNLVWRFVRKSIALFFFLFFFFNLYLAWPLSYIHMCSLCKIHFW